MTQQQLLSSFQPSSLERITFTHINKFPEYKELERKIVYAESFMDDAFPELFGHSFTIKISDGLQCAGAVYDYGTIIFSGIHCGKMEVNHVGWVLSHELAHGLQDKTGVIPSGEKATSLFAVSRIPLKFINNVSYLNIPEGVNVEVVKDLAVQAVKKRSQGYRTYIKWFEDEVNKRECS
jgi:hypothetical protein